MQTINIDGTAFTVRYDCDVIALTKAARKPYKPKKPKETRRFPSWMPSMSTGDYVRQFESLNCLTKTEYDNLNYSGTALYDPSIPLLEVLNDE